MDHKFKSKWESNDFLFDKKDCGYQGLTWPQTNYMCNFCNKEYKSAQALGGHMNVHRRDRARLRLSSPPLDHHHPNPNPKYASPPSPVRYLPYKTYHSSLFPLLSTTNSNDEQQKLPLIAYSGIDFLGCMTMEDGEGEEENGIRVRKKNDILNTKMEMGLLTVRKIELDLDLELRLGRS